MLRSRLFKNCRNPLCAGHTFQTALISSLSAHFQMIAPLFWVILGSCISQMQSFGKLRPGPQGCWGSQVFLLQQWSRLHQLGVREAHGWVLVWSDVLHKDESNQWAVGTVWPRGSCVLPGNTQVPPSGLLGPSHLSVTQAPISSLSVHCYMSIEMERERLGDFIANWHSNFVSP